MELVRATGKTVAEVARDLQINDTTLGNWVKADRAERGEPDSSGLLPLTGEVGLPAGAHTGVRFHDLRHTCGSQWLADGHDMFSVSRWLGHSSIAFTDAVYAHVAQAPDYTAAIERTQKAKIGG